MVQLRESIQLRMLLQRNVILRPSRPLLFGTIRYKRDIRRFAVYDSKYIDICTFYMNL